MICAGKKLINILVYLLVGVVCAINKSQKKERLDDKNATDATVVKESNEPNKKVGNKQNHIDPQIKVSSSRVASKASSETINSILYIISYSIFVIVIKYL